MNSYWDEKSDFSFEESYWFHFTYSHLSIQGSSNIDKSYIKIIEKFKDRN